MSPTLVETTNKISNYCLFYYTFRIKKYSASKKTLIFLFFSNKRLVSIKKSCTFASLL